MEQNTGAQSNIVIKPEVFLKEKKRYEKLHKHAKIDNLSTQELMELLQKKAVAEKYSKKERPDFGIRNFMMPSYHVKTHF